MKILAISALVKVFLVCPLKTLNHKYCFNFSLGNVVIAYSCCLSEVKIRICLKRTIGLYFPREVCLQEFIVIKDGQEKVI